MSSYWRTQWLKRNSWYTKMLNSWDYLSRILLSFTPFQHSRILYWVRFFLVKFYIGSPPPPKSPSPVMWATLSVLINFVYRIYSSKKKRTILILVLWQYRQSLSPLTAFLCNRSVTSGLKANHCQTGTGSSDDWQPEPDWENDFDLILALSFTCNFCIYKY